MRARVKKGRDGWEAGCGALGSLACWVLATTAFRTQEEATFHADEHMRLNHADEIDQPRPGRKVTA